MSVTLFEGSHHLDRRASVLIADAGDSPDDTLLDTVHTALWLGTSQQWLEIGRSRGWGPPYLKLSPRKIRYRIGDVKCWLSQRAYRCTAEYEQKLDRLMVVPSPKVKKSIRARMD